jgi:arylsulfatase A-like enzyme
MLNFVFVAALSSVAVKPKAPRPHIVFVLADDLGWFDTAVYNKDSPTKTLVSCTVQQPQHYLQRLACRW